MKTIAVTGGGGKLGSQVIEKLQLQGHDVVSLDKHLSDRVRCRQIIVDLNDYGQVVGALAGVDAIIHLAAIPAPLHYPHSYIFANNTLSGYHVLEAASLLGIKKVIMGSSESSYGFAWANKPFAPDYFPVDEQHPQQPQECYGLSKIVNEVTAEMFHRRSGIQVISLRFSMIVGPGEYRHLAIAKAETFKHILWSYIDIRDAVDACLAALHADYDGAVHVNVTANDTLSDQQTTELLATFYPNVKDLRTPFSSREAIVSNGMVKDVLSWGGPKHSWADEEQE
ncbi:NAD(P)-dependent oxidoreductase [Paenibacillus sp. LK1]|uniref:NAD-dependent epimerase/dehydratase family protein n=1 Tax=Paenibacillus sp. LK1 TaxID=2053014 RepID=UPI000C1A7EA0|nr:NAD(P)-dependent oxidoreductase [Paenibacillus sp. LK1]PIH60502.1 epimerase [Paenibacillus sp. LK1]